MRIIEVNKPYFYIDNTTGDLIDDINHNYDYSVCVCQEYPNGFPELEEGDILYKLKGYDNRGVLFKLEKNILYLLNSKLETDFFEIIINNESEKTGLITYEVKANECEFIDKVSFSFKPEFYNIINNTFALFNKTVNYNNTGNMFWFKK